jgi:hypothetical protein
LRVIRQRRALGRRLLSHTHPVSVTSPGQETDLEETHRHPRRGVEMEFRALRLIEKGA